MTIGCLSCILDHMRPTPEQIARAREIASSIVINDGVYTIRKGARKVVTGHLRATDAVLDLYEIPEHSDAVIAELALDEALDRSLDT